MDVNKVKTSILNAQAEMKALTDATYDQWSKAADKDKHRIFKMLEPLSQAGKFLVAAGRNLDKAIERGAVPKVKEKPKK